MMLGVSWINSQVVFDGIVQGLAIAMIAVGVVLIYRTTRIINFAVANMGVVGAAILSLLVVQYHVPFWASLVIALVIGVALGALVEIGIIRRLHKAPRVVLLVGTIGLAQVLQVIGDEVPLPSNESAHYPSGIAGSWTLGGITIRGSDLDILILVPIAVIALAWFLERTLLGKTVKACATNPQLARISSISPKLVSTMVWALGAALATLALVLIGGETSLAGSLASIGPETLSFGLAAALLAKMFSFPRALVAGVAIGIGQSLISFNFIADTGLTELMIFVTVLVAVMLYGRERSGDQEVFAFTPRSRPIPERLRSFWWARNVDKSGLIILGIVAVILPIIVTTPSSEQLYTSVLAFAICACSVTVITGWQGQLSLGQMAIAGIATLLAARLVHSGVPFWAAIAVMTLGAALLAIGLGISSLRVRGLYLAVVTFTFALAAQQYFYYLPALSGDAPDGANVPFPVGKLWFISFPGQRAYYYAVLVILVLVLVILSRFRDSNVGRTMKAVRDNENAASAYTLVPADQGAGLRHRGRPGRIGWVPLERGVRRRPVHLELLPGRQLLGPGHHGGHRGDGVGDRRGGGRHLGDRHPGPRAKQHNGVAVDLEHRPVGDPVVLSSGVEPDQLCDARCHHGVGRSSLRERSPVRAGVLSARFAQEQRPHRPRGSGALGVGTVGGLWREPRGRRRVVDRQQR